MPARHSLRASSIWAAENGTSSPGGRSVSVSRRRSGTCRAYSHPRRVRGIMGFTENQQPATTAAWSSSELPENQWNTQRQRSRQPVWLRMPSTSPADLTEWMDMTVG